MIVFGIMALSVLSGIGLTLVMDWLRPRAKILAPVLAVVVLGLVWLEYWNPPVYLSPLSTPAGLEMIRDDPGDFAVVDAPLGRRNGWTYAGDPTGGTLANYYQTIYEKATVGGYLSRVKDEEFDWFIHQPGLHFLACVNVDLACGGQPRAPAVAILPTGDDQNTALVRQVFAANKIKYVIVHKMQPDGVFGLLRIGPGEITAMSNYARDVIGMDQVYDDATLTVFRIRESG